MTQPAKGALRELAEDPGDRKRFLRMMGGAGAAGALAVFLAACGEDEESSSGGGSASMGSGGSSGSAKQDLEIVQYALTLEHLETDFYNAVIGGGEATRMHKWVCLTDDLGTLARAGRMAPAS